MIVGWSPYAYDYLNTHIRSAYSGRGGTPKRFYIVRKGVSRGAVNEAEVQEFFTRHGWALVDAAELSLQEQIDIFRNAEAICGLHGAGLVNLQWCRPGTHAIEIFPSTFLSGCYELLALYQQLRYKSLIFPGDIFRRTHVDLDELGQYLSEQGLI